MRVRVCSNRQQLGIEAAGAVAESFRSSLHRSAIFAAAPSQQETLAELSQAPGIEWDRVTAFHLDEYGGTPADAPHSFRRFLMDRLFSKVPIKQFHGLQGEATNLPSECERYASLLADSPPSIGLLGIGENGHLAFNDPPEARFDEPATVRVVRLTETCRLQQVHDATFPTLDAVPHTALTVTIPALMKIDRIFVMVPGIRKALAVKTALDGPLHASCPASILRMHPDATLFLDEDSASLLSR